MQLDKSSFSFYYSGFSSEVLCLTINICRNSEERIFFNDKRFWLMNKQDLEKKS